MKIDNDYVECLSENYIEKMTKLTSLKMDLSNNEIEDNYYAELMKILSNLNELNDLNLSL